MNEVKNFINPNALPNVQCDPPLNKDSLTYCLSDTFVQKYHIKKVSKFQSGNGQEGYIIVPVYVCAKCGKELLLK
jgi:hypothetical protein